MCPSTVWHLVFHYIVWCEGTINVTFTLKTLLGRVYVQLLTYEDVSLCITLTLSPRLLTNVLLKTRSHTRANVFLTKTYLYSFFCHMWLMSISRTFPLLLLERMSLHNFWHTRQHFQHVVEHASKSFASVKPMFSDTISYVKSCIMRRVRKLSRAVVHRFDYEKHADICLKLRIDMIS